MLSKFKNRINHLKKDVHLSELLTKGSASFFIKIGGMLVAYVLAMVITNNYGANFFGQYVTALLLLEILSIISRLGIDTSVVRFFSSFNIAGQVVSIKKLYAKASLILLLSSSVFASATYFFSSEISEVLSTKAMYIQLVSLVLVPLVMFYLNAQALRGFKKISYFTFFNTVALPFGALIFLLIGNYLFNDADVPLYAYMISVLIMSLLSFIIYFKNIPKGNESSKKETVFKTSNLLKVSFPLLLGQSMMLIMGKVDLLMLANMSTQESVGIYSIAVKVSMLSYMGLMAINSIAAPKFSELYASGKIDELKKIVQQSTKAIFWITLPVVLIFIFFPSMILSLFGEEFKAAIYCLLILSLGKMFSAISGSVGTLLQMSGKEVFFQNVLIASAILNVVLNYILIPIYDIDGAAIASLISNLFWNILMVFYIKKHLGFYTIYLPGLKR